MIHNSHIYMSARRRDPQLTLWLAQCCCAGASELSASSPVNISWCIHCLSSCNACTDVYIKNSVSMICLLSLHFSTQNKVLYALIVDAIRTSSCVIGCHLSSAGHCIRQATAAHHAFLPCPCKQLRGVPGTHPSKLPSSCFASSRIPHDQQMQAQHATAASAARLHACQDFYNLSYQGHSNMQETVCDVNWKVNKRHA